MILPPAWLEKKVENRLKILLSHKKCSKCYSSLSSGIVSQMFNLELVASGDNDSQPYGTSVSWTSKPVGIQARLPFEHLLFMRKSLVLNTDHAQRDYLSIAITCQKCQNTITVEISLSNF